MEYPVVEDAKDALVDGLLALAVAPVGGNAVAIDGGHDLVVQEGRRVEEGGGLGERLGPFRIGGEASQGAEGTVALDRVLAVRVDLADGGVVDGVAEEGGDATGVQGDGQVSVHVADGLVDAIAWAYVGWCSHVRAGGDVCQRRRDRARDRSLVRAADAVRARRGGRAGLFTALAGGEGQRGHQQQGWQR